MAIMSAAANSIANTPTSITTAMAITAVIIITVNSQGAGKKSA